MFKKKTCNKCGKKIVDKYEFCPYCGNSFRGDSGEEDWGMLGKDDLLPSSSEIKFPLGLNLIFNSLMKNLHTQFSKLDKEMKKEQKNTNGGKINIPRKSGISISISTSGSKPPAIKINSFGDDQKLKQIKKKVKEMPLNTLSKETLKKISTLPKQEPLTNIRRFSEKVVYEIDMPGVKSLKDVSIIKLENSIEIKALAKEKVYFKLISINLPIINYDFSKEKLILELGVKN
jgi:HSP20 family molecular chaperone IbpA